MKSNASLLYNIVLVVGDFLALLLAYVGAYGLRITLNHTPVAFQVHAITYIEVFLFLLPFWIIIFALLGLYDNSIYEKRFPEAGRLLIGSLTGMLFVIGINYFLFIKHPIFPGHIVPLYGLVLAFLFLLIFRNAARFVRSMLFAYGIGVTNVLIVGNTKLTHELVDNLFDYKVSGYRVVGVVGPTKHNNELFSSVPIFTSFEDATKKLGSDEIHSIVQTQLYADTESNNEVLSFAQTNHISYRFIPGNTELFVGNIEVQLFKSSIPVIAVHQTPLIGWGRIIKRLFDFIVSIILIVVLSWLFVLIALLIVIFDFGPIFFKQKRITRFNSRFTVFKFRTMKQKYSGKNPIAVFKSMGRDDLVEQYQNAQKLSDDPRVSMIGRFLRRFSLDELPQLFNVLKGDISLVGPRAVVPEELKYYEERSPLLLSVKTGITGLAQISGRSDLDYYERARLDFYYVQNWSFWMDVVILLKTVRVVFIRSGVR